MKNSNLNRLINNSIFLWDYYLIEGNRDYLKASNHFMDIYRKNGGNLYKETEEHIKAHLKNIQKSH